MNLKVTPEDSPSALIKFRWLTTTTNVNETRTASVKTKSRRRADNFFTMNSMCERSSSADGHRLKRLGPKTINTRNQEESFFVLVFFAARVSTAFV